MAASSKQFGFEIQYEFRTDLGLGEMGAIRDKTKREKGGGGNRDAGGDQTLLQHVHSPLTAAIVQVANFGVPIIQVACLSLC
jgi:hypothetical protein